MDRWLGVDVGGKRKGFDIALIDARQVLALAGHLNREEVIEHVETEQPTVVAIDSPRCCAPPGQTTRWSE
jgi:predicted nuclease with RNAse H fold